MLLSAESRTAEYLESTTQKTPESLCVRLVLRASLVEGWLLQAFGLHTYNVGKGLERHLQAPGIIHLRDETRVGKRHLSAERIGTGTDHLLQRLEALQYPMMIPGVDRRLLLAEFL